MPLPPVSPARARIPQLAAIAAAMVVALVTGCRGGPGAGIPRVDLTAKSSFPKLLPQQGNSCAQHVGLYYLLAAEIGRTRGTSPALSPHAAYSMLAETWQSGTHVVDGWILASGMGVPAFGDWPRLQRGWMDGFDRYVRAQRYRPAAREIHPLRTDDDLRQVKKLIASGRPVACDFQVRGARLERLPAGAPGGGGTIAVHWGTRGQGHVMAYAGYDDSVGFDFNGDGRITNDVDITGDGRVTLADRERGAFLAINPWGSQGGAARRVWSPYREHAVSSWPLSKDVATVTAGRERMPEVMLRLRLRIPERRGLILTAGTADSPRATAPDRTWSPLPFRVAAEPFPDRPPSAWEVFARLHRRGPALSSGALTTASGGPVEIGLNVSPLARRGVDRWFLDVSSAGGPLRGEILSAAFVRLHRDGSVARTIPLDGFPAVLPPNGGRWMSAPGR